MDDVKNYAVDWSHKTDKLAVTDGKKITKTLPDPSPEIVIWTENMPAKYAKKFLDVGAKVLRCKPNDTAKAREQVQKNHKPDFEKTDENDVRVIWALSKTRPELFRPFRLPSVLSCAYATFKDFQEVRIRTNNRLFIEEDNPVLGEFFKTFEKAEKQLLKAVETKLKEEPIYNEWLLKIKGIGPAIAGGLVALIGDIERFNTVSALWAYSGYGVYDGKVQKKTKGQPNNWAGKIRSLMYNVVDMFIKHRTPIYRDIYDKEKALQVSRGISLGHAHNRAIRKTAKIFLQHYWVVARTQAGLSVSQPWVLEHGGHCDYIEVPNWNKPTGCV